MILFILLLLKFILFYTYTKVSYMPGLALVLDLFIISFLLPMFMSDKKKYKVLGAIFYCLISLIAFADVTYFSYFNRMPVITELGHAGNLGDVTDVIPMFLKIQNFIFILDIPFVLFAYFKNWFAPVDKWFLKQRSKAEIGLLFVSITMFLFISFGEQSITASKMSLFGYHSEDIVKAFSSHEEVSTVEIEEHLDRAEETYRNQLTGLGKGKNLIVIQVESLSNFVVGKKYEGVEITPNLNKLITEKSSVYASQYIETIGAGNTSDAEFVSLHSMHPTMKNPAYEVYLNSDLYGLPKILADENYDIAAYHGYKRDFWIRDRAYPHIGINKFYAEDNYELDDVIGMGLSDKSFFRQSLPLVSKMKEPFFSFMITLTSHVPYEMPKEDHKMPLTPKDEGSFFGNYLNAVHYTDAAIGEFIDGLKEKGLYDNTIIAIYGDHHGITGQDKEVVKRVAEFTGRDFDFFTVMNIPLILHVPGLEEPIRVDDVRGQIDLTPTILNIMGIDKSKYIMFGKDILDPSHENAIFPQGYMIKGSVITNDYIFAMQRDGIFENGILSHRTDKEVDKSELKRLYLEAIKSIDTSNRILDNNLLLDLMKNKDMGELVEYEKPEKAVIVQKGEELKEAYKSGYKNFYVKLAKTDDGYYLANPNNTGSFELLKEDYISLGDMLGYYENAKFIVEIEDPVELATYIRTIPGIHNNLTILVKNQDEYKGVAYKQNGYKVLVDGQGFTGDEIKQMAEGNAEILFVNIENDDLKSRSYSFDDTAIKICELADMELNDNGQDIELKERDERVLYESYNKLSKDDILHYKDSKPLVLDFKYDEENDRAYTELFNGEIVNSEEIAKLLEDNQELLLALDAKSFGIEIFRSISTAHPDMTRLLPILYDYKGAPFVRRMGYENYIFRLDKGDKETRELEFIYQTN